MALLGNMGLAIHTAADAIGEGEGLGKGTAPDVALELVAEVRAAWVAYQDLAASNSDVNLVWAQGQAWHRNLRLIHASAPRVLWESHSGRRNQGPV